LEYLPFVPRLLNALTSYAAYLGMTFWPSGLAAFYPLSPAALSPGRVAAAALLVAGLTWLVLGPGRRWPYLAVGWLWFLGTLVPVIGLVQVGSQAMADRYTYVPHIGLFVAVVWGASDLASRLRCPAVLAGTAVGLLLAGCALATWLQVTCWHNDITLWEHALEVNPDNYLAHGNLGLALWDRGMLGPARQHLAEAVRLNPHYLDSRFNYGFVLEKAGDFAAAQEEFAAVLRQKPGDVGAHFHLGVVLWAQGRGEAAAAEYAEALRLDPAHAAAAHNLGSVRWAQARRDEAVACFRRAVELRPDVARHQSSLAYALHEQGHSAEAEAHYREALRLDPTWPDTYVRGAWALATAAEAGARDGPLAVQLAQQACQATGNRRPEYLDVLAAAWAAIGRYDDAVRAADQAATLARAGGQTALAEQVEQRRGLYQARQPFRQPLKP
jgi:tetratricopeptide (TPR) repeat protein